MADVPADAWDGLAGDDNPFVEHAFLAALEATACVGPEAGWEPVHLTVWREGALVGAAPMYVKDNSYGEYIFDWGWANACQRAGVPYYPKLVSAVPFTPAAGPRMLTRDAAVRAAIAKGAFEIADALGASSIHWLFTPENQREGWSSLGFRPRLSHQYHWQNLGWSCMDDYLAAMTSKRRKEVRRERRQAAASGFELGVERLTDWTREDLAALYRCYRSTIAERGAIPYLTEAWWMSLPETLGHRAWVATAREEGRLVAGALGFAKGRHLYGRYWGSLVEQPALHFELCYYQFIELALREGYTRFEAGAQGMHKISRGFLPVATHSAHWVRHPGLDRAVAAFLKDEEAHVVHDIERLMSHSPFREASS